MKATSGKNRLLEKLYLNILENRSDTDLLYLEQVLPEQQRWLGALKRLPEDESHFIVVENITETSDAERIITPAVTQLIQRQLHQEDENLRKAVSQAAHSTPKYKYIILRLGCTIFIRLNRIDAALQLLPSIDPFDRTKHLVELTQQTLRPRQYQIILSFITSLSSSTYCYESDEDKLLKKLPPELVNEERKRRAQGIVQEAEAAFDKLNNVATRHPQFNAIGQAVDKLIEHNALGAALSLCQKLVACNQRDRYANRLFQRALLCDDYALATYCCRLFRDNQHRKNLNTYMQHYQKNNYRAALSSLMRLENCREYLLYIYECAKTILTTGDTPSATQFLESKGILALPDDLDATREGEAVKKRILQQLVSNCKDTKALKKLIDRLDKNKDEEITVYLLTILLESDQLSAAIYLLNLNANENYGMSELPHDLTELMNTYLTTQKLTIAQLKILSEINSKQLLSNFIRVSFQSFSLEFAKNNLVVVLAIPDPKQRSHFIVETVILAICQGEFQLAEAVAIYLAEKDKGIWLQIVNQAKFNNCVELLDILVAETINDDRLFRWIINRWIEKVKSQRILIDYLLTLISKLELLHRSKPKEDVGLADLYCRKERLYRNLFNHIALAWYQSLRRISAYNELVAGIAILLPEANKVSLSHILITPLREVIDWLIEHNGSDTIIALKLLLNFEDSFPVHYLSQIIDKLLNLNALKTACAVVELVERKHAYWHECTALKLAARYLQQGDYATVIRLLKPYQSSYSVREKVTAWVITMINSGKLEHAKLLIDELLSDIHERHSEQIITALVARKHVIFARRLLLRIETPSLQLRLKQDLQQSYLSNLEQWIGQDCAKSLYNSHKKLVEFLQLVKKPEPEQLEKANRLKNEIIVELRSQLDKAFLSFYRDKYGEPPMHGDSKLNVFFPVVPELKGKTVQDRLQAYFTRKLKIPNFTKDFPELFAYILGIQPLHNPGYLWLAQLYNFANKQKHDKDIPLEPPIEGMKISMVDYLPKVLIGTNELLLKLFHPSWGDSVVADLCFTNYVPLEVLKLNPTDTNHHLMLLKPPSPSRDLPPPPSAPNVNNSLHI